jgi:hypothetical protein
MKKFDFQIGERYLTNIPNTGPVVVLYPTNSGGAVVELDPKDGTLWCITVDKDGAFDNNTPFGGCFVTNKCDLYGNPIDQNGNVVRIFYNTNTGKFNTIDDNCKISLPFGYSVKKPEDQYMDDIKKIWFSRDELSDMWDKYED